MKEMAEKEAENFLAKEGFDVIKRETAKTKEELIKVQDKFLFPWVMKVSGTVVHKAKVGGVIMGIKSLSDANSAYDRLSKIEGFKEVMIQPQIKGDEIIIGLKSTPEFSHVLMFGKGGSRVEKEKDVSFRILPASDSDIKEMMAETLIYNKLDLKQIKNIETTLEKIAKLSYLHKEISELDINPLIVNEREAMVVDARILMD